MDIRQKILVVDDEQSICELMKINLEIAGYDVDIAYSAEDALRLNLEEYALMVFDIMMGNISGLQLVSMVRQMPKIANVPIIVCTALSEERPLVEGFSRGADDYIKKPFSMKEFVLRVKSLLRRTSKTINNSNVSYKSLTLDNSSKLCYIDGKEVALTKKEFDILYLLISNPGKVFSQSINVYIYRTVNDIDILFPNGFKENI